MNTRPLHPSDITPALVGERVTIYRPAGADSAPLEGEVGFVYVDIKGAQVALTESPVVYYRLDDHVMHLHLPPFDLPDPEGPNVVTITKPIDLTAELLGCNASATSRSSRVGFNGRLDGFALFDRIDTDEERRDYVSISGTRLSPMDYEIRVFPGTKDEQLVEVAAATPDDGILSAEIGEVISVLSDPEARVHAVIAAVKLAATEHGGTVEAFEAAFDSVYGRLTGATPIVDAEIAADPDARCTRTGCHRYPEWRFTVAGEPSTIPDTLACSEHLGEIIGLATIRTITENELP